MKSLFLFILIFSFWIGGCGGNHTKEQNTNISSSYIAKSIGTQAKKSYGYLANATVNIYELVNGTKKLLFSEKTSDADTLENIGNFHSHQISFRPNRYYQIEVFGGENWDIDNNNIKDHKPTPNTKHYRAIYKGHTLHTNWWQTTMSGIKTGGE